MPPGVIGYYDHCRIYKADYDNGLCAVFSMVTGRTFVTNDNYGTRLFRDTLVKEGDRAFFCGLHTKSGN